MIENIYTNMKCEYVTGAGNTNPVSWGAYGLFKAMLLAPSYS
jgi:hypothetical protein